MAKTKQLRRQQMTCLPTKDIVRAIKFYAKVLELDSTTFIHQQDPSGAISSTFPMVKIDSNNIDILPTGITCVLTQNPKFKPSQEGTIVYLPCDDIDATLERVERYGGKILEAKFPDPVTLPDTEIYHAFFLDTEGNRVGLAFCAVYVEEVAQVAQAPTSVLTDKSALVTLTEENFTRQVQETQAQLVLIDFWAPWCGPCRTIAPHLEALATEFTGTVKIVKVNTDEQPALAKHYSIKSLPTLLLFDPKQGKEVARIVGAQGKEAIKAFIDKHLTIKK